MEAYGNYLDSECAPFIQAMLEEPDDKKRTEILLVFSDWLEEHGDKGNYKWFRHPNIRWKKTDYGSYCWYVDPMNNSGHGSSARIDFWWWVGYYLKSEWLQTKDCEDLVTAWIRNTVYFDDYPWAKTVADRLGLNWKSYHDERDKTVERRRLEGIELEKHERSEYERLKKKYEGV